MMNALKSIRWRIYNKKKDRLNKDEFKKRLVYDGCEVTSSARHNNKVCVFGTILKDREWIEVEGPPMSR